MDTDIGIEFNDYDALLLAAQAKHKMYLDEVNKYRASYDVEKMEYPLDIRAKLDAASDEWNNWVKRNITDRGIKLEDDALRRPTAIIAVLASRPPNYI